MGPKCQRGREPMWKLLIVEDDLDVAELIAQAFPSKEYTIYRS